MRKNKKFHRRARHGAGFTLIELLVTIVIIGILATISVSTFNGYFEKARDAARIQQFKQTVDLLKQYVVINNKLPVISSAASWRVVNKIRNDKIITFEEEFGHTLKEDYFDSGIDGIRFYNYGAGSDSCPASKGRFFVFISELEQIKNGDKTREELGMGEYTFSCPGRNWTTHLGFGIFENGDFGPQS
jgi:prepilin-type N-terminal cleavage/methylation domain-containing protein